MARRNGSNGHGAGKDNGSLPSGNGDPFRTFVIHELGGIRTFMEEQRDFNDEQREFNTDQRKFNKEFMGMNRSLILMVQTMSRRMERQDRINRLIYREFRRLRRSRR